MPRDIQEVWNDIKLKQSELKELKKVYKDALTASGEYPLVKDKMETLKAEKKRLEILTQSNMESQMKKMEVLARDIATDRDMMSDMALSNLLKGEIVKITDGEIPYEPFFSVRFRKKK